MKFLASEAEIEVKYEADVKIEVNLDKGGLDLLP